MFKSFFVSVNLFILFPHKFFYYKFVLIIFIRFLKEMEKSGANNFLILFRDSGCQFRSLYTYCPDTEENQQIGRHRS